MLIFFSVHYVLGIIAAVTHGPVILGVRRNK